MASSTIPQLVPCSARSMQELKLTLETITSLLTGDQILLLDLFLEFDKDLDGQIDVKDFHAMLKEFDDTITEQDVGTYISEIVRDTQENRASFTELLDWWELQKVDADGRGNDGWFRTKLTTRFAGMKLKQWTIDAMLGSALDKRLQALTEPAIEQCMICYRDELYLLRLWLHDVRGRAEERAERALIEKAKDVIWTEDEKEELIDLFMRVTNGKDLISLETELPYLCVLLNYDLTYSVLERTMHLYQFRMDFASFLIWWACRPESKKLKIGWKQPNYRWGRECPKGLDVCQD